MKYLKRTKIAKKLNFDLNGLIKIYLAEIPFFLHKKLMWEINDELTNPIYEILKFLNLENYYETN